MPRFRFLGALSLVALSVSGCKRKPEGLARVGPLVISAQEFHAKLAEVDPEYQRYLLTPNGRKQFLDILVREKLKLAAAQDSEVASSREIQQEMAKLKERQELELKRFREHKLVQLWEAALQAKGVLSAPDEEIDEYLRAHPKEISIRHILLGSSDEADAVYRQAKAGAPFPKLAQAHSLDSDTASKGGLLPPFMYGEILPELENVAFSMKSGQTIGVIRTKFGYHILRKEKEQDMSLRDSAVRDRVRGLLERQKFDRHLAGLQEKYPVEVYDESYK